MVTIERVEWADARAVVLRAEMDAETGAIYRTRLARVPRELMERIMVSLAVDPAEIAVTLIATVDGTDVGHTALRGLGDLLEVKKVFVRPPHRGLGVSRRLMVEVERIARDNGVPALVLQTGDLQQAAIGLYESLGYRLIPAFAPYGAFPGEVCYRKDLE